MDEDRLRGLLHLATATEPPIGSLSRDALLAGIRLRRRRRLQGAAGCFATAAVLGAAVPALTGGFGGAARPFAGASGPVVPCASVAAGQQTAARPAGRWRVRLRTVIPVVPPPCDTSRPAATWAQVEQPRHFHMTAP